MAYVEPREPIAPADVNPQSPADAAQGAADAPYKRSGATRPELLKRFRQRVVMSKKWRKDEGYDATWSRLIDIYSNKMFERDTDDDQIAVNVSFSTINTIAPAVSVSYPTISVNPRSPELEEAAQAVEAAVNYWFRHYDWRKETKRSVKDSLSIGHGWAKVWWKYAQGTRPLTADEQSANLAQAQQDAGDAAEADPANAHLQPTNDQLAAANPTTTAHVIADQPCVERVSPRDMLIDPEATCDDDLKWIAQKIVRPLAEVKADPTYTTAGRKAVQADAGTNPRWRDDALEGNASKAYSDDVKRVTLYEFYDLRNNFYCVFAENGGNAFLLEPTELPYAYGHPFVYIGNYDVPDQFYDIGDLEALEPLQMELNAVRSDMSNHRKRYQRAHLALRDKFTPEAMRTLEDPTDGRVIWIEGDTPLEGLVIPLPQEPLDAQMYQYSEQIESDIDLVSGVSEYQRGAQSEIRRTATEASMINDASNARSSDKLSQVEVFLQEIAKRVVQLAQQYLTGDHAVQIIGQDGAKQWISYDGPTIQGEFDFMVEAGSTQPQDENFKRSQALQLATTLAPYVGTTVDPTALVMYILKDGFGIKNPEQFMAQAQPTDTGPSQKFIETMNYADAPPDIQRQMEAEAGFTPSKIGGVVDPAPPAGPGPGDDTQEQPAAGAPDASGAMGAAAPQSGQNIDPKILAQLQGQVGLNDPNAGAPQ